MSLVSPRPEPNKDSTIPTELPELLAPSFHVDLSTVAVASTPLPSPGQPAEEFP